MIRMSIRPRRSVLYMPGSNPRAIEKARTLPADAVILDLEDSVAPDAKATAREQIRDAVIAGGFGAREVIVRINALESAWWLEDLDMVAKAKPDAVLVPKVSTPGHLEDVAERLIDIGADHRIRVWAMMETPLAMLNAREIAAAAADVETRLAAFVMGTNDLAKETRARITPGRLRHAAVADGLHRGGARLRPRYPRRRLQRSRRCAGLRARMRRGARDMGFDGKTLVHPRQIEPCNGAFSPTEGEVALRRGRSSPRSICRRTGTRASSNSTAAWSNACMPTWRGARWRSHAAIAARQAEQPAARLRNPTPRPAFPSRTVGCGAPHTHGRAAFDFSSKRVDLVAFDHGQPDVVETVEQAMLAVGIDVELHHAAVGPSDLLLFQVDGERGIGAALGIVEQLLQVLRRRP